jgi:hypothetical protein
MRVDEASHQYYVRKCRKQTMNRYNLLGTAKSQRACDKRELGE